MSDNRLEGSDASSFLRDLVHELASPLNSISMNAEILEAILQKDVHGSALEAVERLTQDHCRLELLLRGLRTYAEALKIAPPESLVLGELVEQALTVAAWDGLPPIKIEIHSVESILPSVDRSACCHALAAIFRNAVEADASEIVVTIQDEAGMSRLYFDDDGSGIEAAQRIRVFAPFFTLRPNGTHAGLGLAAARAVAVAHGGDIEALDSPRGGARIAMRLRRPPCPASG